MFQKKWKVYISAILSLLLITAIWQTSQHTTDLTYDKLLRTAMKPVGNTMYIWGGGWSSQDAKAGAETVTIGVSKRWAEFAEQCDADYDFNQTRFQRHDGLDCSGYIGWVIYNVFENQSGKEGYVMASSMMAWNFAQKGWGSYTPCELVEDWRPGDIMSMKGHVWMSLGMCEDGSVALVHASPPGVRICGTLLENGQESEAVALARKYMSVYYTKWYEKYPACGVPYDYLVKSSQFRWNQNILKDKQGYSNMSAPDVLAKLHKRKQ